MGAFGWVRGNFKKLLRFGGEKLKQISSIVSFVSFYSIVPPARFARPLARLFMESKSSQKSNEARPREGGEPARDTPKGGAEKPEARPGLVSHDISSPLKCQAPLRKY